jgi:TolB protein
MLWFRDGVELSIYDVSSATILETLPDTPGIFQAPAWSPAGQRLLFTRVEDGANRMTIADGDERIDVGKPVTEPVFFSWSPDGQRIAYAVGGFPLSPIIVVDANGAESLRLTQVEDIFTFFWSPDSTRLAVVALEERVSPGPQARLSGTRARPPLQTDAPRLVSVWYAIDVETGEATRLSEFYPTREQLYILQFFDQYAQSHRLWSPDGRYIVFAEQPPGEDSPLIRLLDTLSPTEPPITLMEGRQAVFSFEE